MKLITLKMHSLLAVSLCFIVAGCSTMANNVYTPIISLFQDRSFGDAVDDVAIRNSIETKLLLESADSLFLEVNVNVFEGRVLLTGTVKKFETKNLAEEIVKKVSDVKEVKNRILVTEKADELFSYSSDASITSQAKSILLLQQEVDSANYEVETVANIVYITGIAKSSKELQQISKSIAQIDGVKQVVTYVRVIEK